MEAHYETRIREVYPDFTITHCEVNQIGQNNDVLIVNRSFVFRFPKYIEGIRKLKTETKVLETVEGNLSLPVPFPLYQSVEHEEVGKVFTGYKMIDGDPLWASIFKKNEGHSQKMASQLVGFLTELHSQSVDGLEIERTRTNEIQSSIVDLYDRIREKLFSHMNEKAKEDVSRHFDSFLSKEDLLDFQPVLIHGDFGASNILWDATRHEVSGIIDFGETEIGDPAYDFAGIFSSYGEPFVRRCLDIYPDGDQIFERMSFYRGTFALQEALHGVEHGDRKAFERGMMDYR